MTMQFDPNIPPYVEAAFTGSVTVAEQPALGLRNLVVNRNKPFDIGVTWHVFGAITPVWLTALRVNSPNWVVTAYAESMGPGPEVTLGRIDVPVGNGPFDLDVPYQAKITVPANALPEENPGNPESSGVYRIIVTAFLDSALGGAGYDVIGYAEGPIIKVENPG